MSQKHEINLYQLRWLKWLVIRYEYTYINHGSCRRGVVVTINGYSTNGHVTNCRKNMLNGGGALGVANGYHRAVVTEGYVVSGRHIGGVVDND